MPPTFSPEERHRIELTVAADDTRSIPKVPGAGEIVQHEDGPAQVMHNGVLIHAGCYHGAWMTEVIRRLRGHHEPQEEAAFHAVVERLARDTPAPVMVELGSFWAYYALWIKRALPGATCILVEPDPSNLEVGRRNFELNGSEGRFIRRAVGLPDGGVARLPSESDGVVRDTPLTTLDGLMEGEGLARVDVLLSDVQGAEVDLLAGAARALAERRVRFWVISTHHHRITGDPLTHQKCLQVLHRAGAHVLTEHTVLESSSGDGLIVASLDDRDEGLTIATSRARAKDSLFGELDHDLADAFAERDRLRTLLVEAEGARDAAIAAREVAIVERDAAIAGRERGRVGAHRSWFRAPRRP